MWSHVLIIRCRNCRAVRYNDATIFGTTRKRSIVHEYYIFSEELRSTIFQRHKLAAESSNNLFHMTLFCSTKISWIELIPCHIFICTYRNTAPHYQHISKSYSNMTWIIRELMRNPYSYSQQTSHFARKNLKLIGLPGQNLSIFYATLEKTIPTFKLRPFWFCSLRHSMFQRE